MAEWSKLFIETADKFGKTMRVVDSMKAWIMDAGFEDVSEVRFKLPVGSWKGWAMFLLTHVLGWKYEEVMVLVAKFKEALRDRKTHAYYDVCVAFLPPTENCSY
ncbi:hypothetical protein SLS58_002595 [Diplodia intermedia]|uniref:Uncharacterized protein n=1 Tax=Diplodia intermedia TaxID=856260 RepID=A0ABR3TZU6_9PEZI